MSDSARIITEAERLFPDQGPVRTYRAAIDKAARRAAFLWNDATWLAAREDKRILELDKFCTGLCDGNANAGLAMAYEAIRLAETVIS